MRKATPLFLMLLLTVPCLAQANQAAPAGPSLDFTLNYINSSIDGSITVTGASVTYATGRHPYPFETDLFDVADVGAKTLSWDANGNRETWVVLECRNRSSCLTHFKQYNKKDSDNTPAENVTIVVKGDQFKAQDVANAFNHLFALVKAQRDAAVNQQRQQNQSDPFANPQ